METNENKEFNEGNGFCIGMAECSDQSTQEKSSNALSGTILGSLGILGSSNRDSNKVPESKLEAKIWAADMAYKYRLNIKRGGNFQDTVDYFYNFMKPYVDTLPDILTEKDRANAIFSEVKEMIESLIDKQKETFKVD